ncbi:MAG: hypothetical protein AB7H66_04705 [Hyphomonadaceae bacterium]
MRFTTHLVAALCAGTMLAACATPGLYQARAGEGGYAETRISDARWHVEFVGDTVSSPETVETYLLYRSAELTLERGYDWFAPSAPAMAGEEDIVVSAPRAEAAPAPVWRPQWRRRSRSRWTDWDPAGPPTPEALPPAPQGVTHYSASADIVMGRLPAPEGAFNARETLNALEPSIVRPPS